jgi:hypothetical protein
VAAGMNGTCFAIAADSDDRYSTRVQQFAR